MPSPTPVTKAPRPRVVAAEFRASAATPAAFPPPTHFELAFAGRSNVGKSSLMNALLGRRRLVRTSSTPGCTRQVCFYDARAGDETHIGFVDLPGYGYARRSKSERSAWAGVVESYLLERPTLRCVALLFDVRRGLESDDLDLLEMLESPARVSRPQLGIVLVATKADKLEKSARNLALERLRRTTARPFIAFSKDEPATHEQLWSALRRAAAL